MGIITTGNFKDDLNKINMDKNEVKELLVCRFGMLSRYIFKTEVIETYLEKTKNSGVTDPLRYRLACYIERIKNGIRPLEDSVGATHRAGMAHDPALSDKSKARGICYPVCVFYKKDVADGYLIENGSAEKKQGADAEGSKKSSESIIHPSFNQYLEDAFFLPLCWEEGEHGAKLIPKSFKDMSEKIKVEVGEKLQINTDRWYLKLNADYLPEIDLSGFGLTPYSAWATIASALIIAIKGGFTRPTAAVVSAAYNGQFVPVEWLKKKQDIAKKYGIKKFFVCSRQGLEQGLNLNDFTFLPKAGSLDLYNSLRPYLAEMQVPPSIKDVVAEGESAFDKCLEYARLLDPVGDRQILEKYLFDNIIAETEERIRSRKIYGEAYLQNINISRLALVVSSPAAALFSILSLRPKKVLIIYTAKYKQEVLTSIRDRERITFEDFEAKVKEYVSNCAFEYLPLQDIRHGSFKSERAVRERVEEFFAGNDSGEKVNKNNKRNQHKNNKTRFMKYAIDVTGGTRRIIAPLQLYAYKQGIKLFAVDSEYEKAERIIATERMMQLYPEAEAEVDKVYLCYDIKGIQQFIYSVPKLQYIIGSSILIDQFDKDLGDKFLGNSGKCKCISSGGGRGTIECDSVDSAAELRKKLIDRAHSVGLDICIGVADNLTQANLGADELYAYIPEDLSGEPCSVSGIWPVGKDGYKTGVNKMIEDRRNAARSRTEQGVYDTMGERIIQEIEGSLPASLRAEKESGKFTKFSFLRAIRATAGDDDKTKAAAAAADFSLDKRNRWAIIALDGNNIGAQYKEFFRQRPGQEEREFWIQEMSKALTECTRGAFTAALQEEIAEWWEDVEVSKNFAIENYVNKQEQELVLPFRPLVIGGDDILCICHSKYAFSMVEKICTKFNELSIKKAEEYREEMRGKVNFGICKLWPASNDRLTISAGVVFCKVTYPLHTAIPYAESLLASAKGRFAQHTLEGGVAPAALDWEHITEGFIDTPEARRKRELEFFDQDIERNMLLTQRPYSLDEFKELEKKVEGLFKDTKGISRNIYLRAKDVLTKPWVSRVQWYAALSKSKNESLANYLKEDYPGSDSCNLGKGWDYNEKTETQSTWLLDALLLLEEEERFE